MRDRLDDVQNEIDEAESFRVRYTWKGEPVVKEAKKPRPGPGRPAWCDGLADKHWFSLTNLMGVDEAIRYAAITGKDEYMPDDSLSVEVVRKACDDPLVGNFLAYFRRGIGIDGKTFVEPEKAPTEDHMAAVRSAIHGLTLDVASARNRADEEEERRAKVKRAIASNGYEAVSDADMRRYAPEVLGLDLVDLSGKPIAAASIVAESPTREWLIREVDSLAGKVTRLTTQRDLESEDNERLKREVASLKRTNLAATNAMTDLNAEIAALKAAAEPPPEPTASEVLERAMRW